MRDEPARILIVDDEYSVRDSLENWFRKDGHQVASAPGALEALQALEQAGYAYDLVFLDIKMPGMDGIELQKRIHETDPSVMVIMITAFASVETAVKALKQGAFDYVTKPIDPEELSHLVSRALEQKRLRAENEKLRGTIDEMTSGSESIVGHSPQMLKVMDLIRQVAKTDASVLVRGESGTGKELIARAIHAASARRYFPIVPVNCGALAEGLLESELFGHEKGAFTGALYRHKGKFEMASGGTLFLDEIGTIPPKTQVELLRVLESKELTRVGSSRPLKVDFRLVCATNDNLEKKVEDGRFREDLYYRINVFTIDVPPLRERTSDIPALAEHFVRRYAMQMDKRMECVSPAALERLVAYRWPGNVRELQNAIERAMVVGKPPAILPEDLPFAAANGTKAAAGDSLEDVERHHIAHILSRAAWNVTRAAEVLGIDRATLYHKIKKYELRKPS